MKMNRTHMTNKDERGIALFMAIFALMLLSAIAAGFMFLANTESAINTNNKAGQLAFFTSRAGLEEFKARIVNGATAYLAPPTALPTLANRQIFYILNPGAGEVVQPWAAGTPYFDDTLCQAHFSDPTLLNFEVQPLGVRCTTAPAGAGWYQTFPSNDPNTGTVAAMPYKWVRIMLKANNSEFPYLVSPAGSNTALICYDAGAKTQSVLPAGNANCKANNSSTREVYVITSLAVTPTGGRRITQVEVTQIALPPLPGAMTFTGANPVFSPPGSAAFSVTGDDQKGRPAPGNGPSGHCYTTEPTTIPAIGAQGGPADATLATAVAGNAAQWTGAGGSPSAQDVTHVPIPGTNPVQYQDNLGPYGTVGGLQSILSTLQNAAGPCNNYPNNCGPNGALIAGPSGPPAGITVINGPYSGGISGGSGILVVTGDLTMGGNPSFNGMILVIGTGKVIKNGGGNGVMDGGILFANLFDSSGNPLPSSSPPGIANVTWHGGGNAAICYDSTAMNLPQNNMLYQNLAYSELPY